jgi:hypothetical protein
MKKSELKSLLRIIVQEAIQENKGLSGFKKSKESTEHTEKVADAKTLTPISEPKEKKEGKKLPVKDNTNKTETDHIVKEKSTSEIPANEKTESKALPVGGHGSLKEEIVKMIRESLEEMARTAGSIGSKYKVEDPNSPTGWSVKGHKTIPDGTPTEAPKGPYVPKGTNPNMGRPKKMDTGPVNSTASNARTEEVIEDFLQYNPEASEEEVIDAVNQKNSDETPMNIDPAAIKKMIEKIKSEKGSGEVDSKEPSMSDIESSEKASKAEKIAKINKLRAFLMKKKGLK